MISSPTLDQSSFMSSIFSRKPATTITVLLLAYATGGCTPTKMDTGIHSKHVPSKSQIRKANNNNNNGSGVFKSRENQTEATARPVKYEPARKVVTYITRFYQEDIWVFEKTFGGERFRVKHTAFKRVKIPGLHKKGVPVYSYKNPYLMVRLSDGRTGWVDKTVASIIAKPCKTGSIRTTPSAGPVSSGIGSISCD